MVWCNNAERERSLEAEIKNLSAQVECRTEDLNEVRLLTDKMLKRKRQPDRIDYATNKKKLYRNLEVLNKELDSSEKNGEEITKYRRICDDTLNKFQASGYCGPNLSERLRVHELPGAVTALLEENNKAGRELTQVKSALERKEAELLHFRNVYENIALLLSVNDLLEVPGAVTALLEENNKAGRELMHVKSALERKEAELDQYAKVCDNISVLQKEHQLGPARYEKINPKTSPVILSDAVSKIVQDVSRGTMENKSLKEEKRQLLAENTKLLRENEQLREREVARTDREQASVEEQHPLCNKVLGVLSSISAYEDTMKGRDVSEVNGRLANLNRSLWTQYGGKIRNCNIDILKLVQTINDPQITKQHDAFKQEIRSVTERIQNTQEGIVVLPPAELVRKFGDLLGENERQIKDLLEVFLQILTDFPEIEAHRKRQYDALVSTLEKECARLVSLTLPKSETQNRILVALSSEIEAASDKYVKDTLVRVLQINTRTWELEQKVDKFRGSSTDKMYLDLEHKLMQNIMEVDEIQTNSFEVVREKRREAIDYAQSSISKLKNNSVDNIE